jgi:hypothetical protein
MKVDFTQIGLDERRHWAQAKETRLWRSQATRAVSQTFGRRDQGSVVEERSEYGKRKLI